MLLREIGLTTLVAATTGLLSPVMIKLHHLDTAHLQIILVTQVTSVKYLTGYICFTISCSQFTCVIFLYLLDFFSNLSVLLEKMVFILLSETFHVTITNVNEGRNPQFQALPSSQDDLMGVVCEKSKKKKRLMLFINFKHLSNI